MTRPQHLVLAGAGHAHLTAIGRIPQYRDAGLRVTVVNTSSLHYYSGMGPGMLGGTYTEDDIRFNVRSMAESRGAVFLEDPVVEVLPENRTLRLQSGMEVEYDACSFNVGSGVPLVPETDAEHGPEIFPVKPITKLVHARQRLLELLTHGPKDGSGRPALKHIAVVGGGAAGVEIAGNAHLLAHGQGPGRPLRQPRGVTEPPLPVEPRITLFAGTRLLSRFPAKVRNLALKSMAERDIAVVEGSRVAGADNGAVRLKDGREFPAQVVFWATGVTPNPMFVNSGLPTGPDGGLLVNERLQAVEHPELFGGGDCIHFQPLALDKVGVHAVRENPILAYNVLAWLKGGELKSYAAQNVYLLLLNLGDGTAIFRRKAWVFRSRLAMWLKDRIDTKFMRRFKKLEA